MNSTSPTCGRTYCVGDVGFTAQIVAGLLRRLWIEPPTGHLFRPLHSMRDWWADEFDEKYAAGTQLFRNLPGMAKRSVLLCTDTASYAVAPSRTYTAGPVTGTGHHRWPTTCSLWTSASAACAPPRRQERGHCARCRRRIADPQ